MKLNESNENLRMEDAVLKYLMKIKNYWAMKLQQTESTVAETVECSLTSRRT